MTLGYPAIAAAKEVWVLASGAGKAKALRQSLLPDAITPLARVINSAGTRKFSATSKREAKLPEFTDRFQPFNFPPSREVTAFRRKFK